MVQYIFYHRDPRRVQPLVDFLVSTFKQLDFNAELSFDVYKVVSLFRAFYEELGRKFTAWTDEVVELSWKQINGEHDDVHCSAWFSMVVPDVTWQVRVFVSEILTLSQNIKVDSLITSDECLYIHQSSGIRVWQYQLLKSSPRSVIGVLMTSISWRCEAHITKEELLN